MQLGTEVNNADSDGDGDSDGYEWMEGTDANDAGDGTRAARYESGLAEVPTRILSYFKSVSNQWYGGYAAPDSYVSWSGSAGGGGSERYPGYYPLWESRLGFMGYPPHSAGGQIPWQEHPYARVADAVGSLHEGNKVGYVSLVYHQARVGSFPQLTPQPWVVRNHLLAFEASRPLGGTDFEYTNVSLRLMSIPQGSHFSGGIDLEPPVEMGTQNQAGVIKPEVTSLTQGIDPVGTLNGDTEPWIMVPAEGTKQVALGAGAGDAGLRWMYRFTGAIPVGSGVEGSAVRTAATFSHWITLLPTMNQGEGAIHAGIALGSAGTPVYAENEPLMRVLVLPKARLSVVVHPITLLAADGSVIAAPVNCPTAAQLKSYLDSILKEQANLESDVTVLPTVALNWDVGVQVPGSDTSGADAATRLNQRLDVLDEPGNFLDDHGHIVYAVSDAEKDMYGKSMEEDSILTASPVDMNGEVNVYFVAAPGGLQHTQFYPPRHPLRRGPKHMKVNEDGVLGYAGRALPGNGGVIWVYDFDYMPTMPSLGTPTHKWAILHEIVHYVGKVGHATDGGDPTKLTAINHQPNSDNERRVMTGRSGPKRATSPSKLIKFEWERLNRKLGPRGLIN